MSGYSVSRLSLYAAISALEEDLRELINFHLIPQLTVEELLGDLLEKTLERCERDIDFFEKDESAEKLILYIDFAESYQLLLAHKSKLPENIFKAIKKATPEFQKLVPIRNRVMHSRPLGHEDFSITLDVTTGLLKDISEIPWHNLKDTLVRLQKEPSFVLGLQIPTHEISQVNNSHNLPVADFDETGFIGRKKYVSQLIDLCLGSFPVITIHGEGGLGKTALALKVAYEILDMEDSQFDAIVWTTSKTQQLTTQEIKRIEGSICDSLNMFQGVSDFLVGDISSDPIEEVLAYLQEFKILLIIDNLETILDERVRNFLGRLTSTRSKLIITSRISVGAYDYPVRLEPMDASDSVQLLRTLSKIRGLEDKFRASNEVIAEQCERMHNNPGYIKWFVSAVQVGKRPEEILARPEMFLDFCMSNVYQYLGENSRKITSSMLCIPGRHSYAELAFLNSMNEVDLREAINELLTTNMIRMFSIPRGASFESQYELSELARDYLNRKHPVQPTLLREITKRRNQLISDLETIRALASADPYSYNSIAMRSGSDKFIAKYLFDALRQVSKKGFDAAKSRIDEAKRLAPDYFEVYRIEALLKVAENDYPGASRAYETAIELAPNSAPLRKWYGSFLMRYFDDLEGAEIQLRDAYKVDQKSAEVQLELSRVYLYLRRFSEADKLISGIVGRTDLSEREKKIACDLRLQFYLRKAQDDLDKRNHLNSLSALDSLVKTYKKLPRELVDSKMKEKLYKASGIGNILVRNVGNVEANAQAIQVRSQIYEILGLDSQNISDPQEEIINKEIKIGYLMRGKVDSVQSYGVFIKSRNHSGLLHISEISSLFVSQETLISLFQIGKVVTALVKELDEHGRPSLSLKELEQKDGDTINRIDDVFENAEKMAERYRKRNRIN